jgi:hypothetical protein
VRRPAAANYFRSVEGEPRLSLVTSTLLFGRHDNRFERNLGLLFTAGLLLATFAAYAVGVFQLSGGAVLVPEDATLVGFLAAAGIGFRAGGLAFAWLAPVAAFTGFRLEWVALGLSGHSFAEQVGVLLDPVGLSVSAAASLAVGTAGFVVGQLGRSVSKRFKE